MDSSGPGGGQQPGGATDRARDRAAARERRRRRLPALVADLPDLARAGAVGLLAGVASGVLVFAIGSSRGLNSPELERVVIVAGGIGLVIAALSAAARSVFASSSLLVAVVLFVLGATQAYGNGLRIVPGDTTDGTLTVRLVGELPELPGPREAQSRATCHWAGGSVDRAYSRGSATWSLDTQAVIEVDVAAGSASATLTQRVDGTQRSLPGTVGSTQVQGSEGVATFEGANVSWSCPALP